jgi:N-methylhydantoinase A
MMRAIRAVSVERGRDPRRFALLAFGGNGPLFGAALARELGIGRMIVPPFPGVFSAFGLLVAETEHHASRSLRLAVAAADPDTVGTVLHQLRSEAEQALARQGFAPARQSVRLHAQARYLGQSSELAVDLPEGSAADLLAALPARFAAEHERTYGFRAPDDEPIEITGFGLVARGLPDQPRLPSRIPPAPAGMPQSRRIWLDGTGWQEVPVLDRAAVSASARPGPLIVQEYDATCLVPPGATAACDGFGNIVVRL